MPSSAALAYLEENYDRFQNELIELVRIPSISIEPEHDADIKRAASWLADKLRSIGVEHVGILPTTGHPVVYADWLHGGPNTPTVLIYGHCDVQFPQPLEDWKSDPFVPEIRNENLDGRGVSDMKGQVLAATSNSTFVSTSTTGQRSPRVSFMISSVRIRTVALPRTLANALRLASLAATGRTTTSPFGVSSNDTLELGPMPRKSLTFLGTVTCPLVVNVVAILVLPLFVLVLL